MLEHMSGNIHACSEGQQVNLYHVYNSQFTYWSLRWNSACTRYAGGLVTAGDLARARPQLKPAMRAHAYGVEVSGRALHGTALGMS